MTNLEVVLLNFSKKPKKARRQKLYIFLLLSQKLIIYILKAPCVREKRGNIKRTDHYYTSTYSITLHGIKNRTCYSRSSIASQFTPALSGSIQTFKKNLKSPFILKE